MFTYYALPITACNPTWSTSDNTHAFGGTTYPAANTEATCLAACAADQNCVGVDFASSNNGCWFHTDVTDFIVSNQAPETGTRLIVLQDRCPSMLI